MTEPHQQNVDRVALCLGPALLAGTLAWLATWTGPGQPAALADAAWVLTHHEKFAMAWLIAAVGVGWPLRMLLLRRASEGLALQIGLGVAALLVLDETLGVMGLLQRGGGFIAWVTIAVGSALAAVQFFVWLGSKPKLTAPPWLAWCVVPSLGVLLVAACSAPGWLWATEFGGYDALSYHLQLPKEWLAHGRIEPLTHNVYSFLPGYMEAAYYHLAVLIGDDINAVYACQLLHAGLAVLTAFVIGRLGGVLIGPRWGAMVAVLFLGTPWVIVVGSLGYNEIPTLLMLACGMLVICETRIGEASRGAAIGFLAATACGAKMTSIGMIAAPLAVLLLATGPRRHVIRSCVVACAAGAAALLPYFIRNESYAGNPVFPFATGLFGAAHWSAEQVAIWHAGHFTNAGVMDRLAALWSELLRYGFGADATAGDGWKPQWSVLPWLGMIGIATGLVVRRHRSIALRLAVMLAIQITFWLCFTHLKSRFLLPATIPLCLGALLGVRWLGERAEATRGLRRLRFVIVPALIAWSCAPMMIYWSERGHAPAAAIGQVGSLTGDELSADARRELGSSAIPAIAVNYLLPAESKVLAVGFAAPLYIRREITYQTTWDRGPLSWLMHSFPDDPDRWSRSLREMGFTHVLVDAAMLQVWERSGWNDPMITAQTIDSFCRRAARLLYQYPGHVTLYELRR